MTGDRAAGQRQMFAWIAGLGDQLRGSGGYPGLAAVTPLAARPHHVLLCGMGGSAMAGSLLADGWPGLAVPFAVWRDEGLPGWADPRTLVIVCSHSGETAETLAALAEARRRGCPTVAITSGGALLAASRGDPHGAAFPAVTVPAGQPPRTRLGASLGALLHVLHRLDLLPDPAADIAAASAQVTGGELVRDLAGAPLGDAAARSLANDLRGRFVVIFTSGADAHGAGQRLLAQLQENAKAAGHLARFPELDHNEIVGWNVPADRRGGFALVVLRGAEETPTDARRVEVTLELLADQFAAVRQVRGHGANRLARCLGLIVFGDLVSAHLAVAAGVDPVPIARIDQLKARLGDR